MSEIDVSVGDKIRIGQVIGKLGSTYQNDRGLERAKPIQDLVKHGMDLCIRARSFDPPLTGRWP